MRPRAPLLVVASLVVLATGACTSPPRHRGAQQWSRPPTTSPPSQRTGLPPIPQASGGGGPNQPPLVWIGGILTKVSSDRLVLKESVGSVVTLHRLGGGATTFFRAVAGAWARQAKPSPRAGDPACVETLLDGKTLLALRVFLGAGCGPA
ncbi:MAG: hypothetical protein E6G44_09585 [Actinobacteria bacterium]|nr:MAG: hypothetical protein E6G44_09585 [Actinomycetota bacterium]